MLQARYLQDALVIYHCTTGVFVFKSGTLKRRWVSLVYSHATYSIYIGAPNERVLVYRFSASCTGLTSITSVANAVKKSTT